MKSLVTKNKITDGGPSGLRRLLGAILLALAFYVPVNTASAHPSAGILDPAKPSHIALIQRFEKRLEQNPRDPTIAGHLVHYYLHRHQQESGQTWIDKAEAVLAPWEKTNDMSSALLMERANLHQRVHRFELALKSIDQLLAKRPESAQALLTRSTILTVLGRYEEAKEANRALSKIASEHVVLANDCAIDSLSGQAEISLDRLTTALATTNFPNSLRPWAYGIAGDIASRLERHSLAEAHYRAGLTLAPDDSYLMVALADLYIDTARAPEVLLLIPEDTGHEGLRLKRILALPINQAKRASETAALNAALEAGHTDSHPHLREEAILALYLLDDPARALKCARANWANQREPADLRIYIEALDQHADTPETQREHQNLETWFQQSGMEWSRIADALKQGR